METSITVAIIAGFVSIVDIRLVSMGIFSHACSEGVYKLSINEI